MVHGELIKAGKVKLLTYRQVHRLEKIDLQKAREAQLVDVGKEVIRAAGAAAEGGFAGIGLALQGFFSGDAIAFAAKSVAGLVFLEWFVSSYPNFSSATHLDWLLLRGGGGRAPNIANINEEAAADIADLKASLPGVIVPPWLQQISTAKSLSQMPDLSQPIRQFENNDPTYVRQLQADIITAVTGGGEGGLINDIHKLYEDFKLQASGALGTGINPIISGAFTHLNP